VCFPYALHITTQCDAKGRVMGITWLQAAHVLSGFFVVSRISLALVQYFEPIYRASMLSPVYE
jgi:hypothetical protein